LLLVGVDIRGLRFEQVVEVGLEPLFHAIEFSQQATEAGLLARGRLRLVQRLVGAGLQGDWYGHPLRLHCRVDGPVRRCALSVDGEPAWNADIPDR